MKSWTPAGVALVAALSVILAGCGYSFQGQSRTSPGGVHRVAIPLVTNTTTYTTLTDTLTNSLIQRFNQSRVMRTTVPDLAEAVLEVAVTSVQIDGAARTWDNQASASRRVSVTVQAKLLRRGDGRALWQVSGLVGRRFYSSPDAQSVVEANLDQALGLVALDLAEKIHDNITEDF